MATALKGLCAFVLAAKALQHMCVDRQGAAMPV